MAGAAEKTPDRSVDRDSIALVRRRGRPTRDAAAVGGGRAAAPATLAEFSPLVSNLFYVSFSETLFDIFSIRRCLGEIGAA